MSSRITLYKDDEFTGGGQPKLVPTVRHWTVKELVAEWNVSTNTIIRYFGREPGVLKLGSPSRRYLRIPDHVAERVRRSLDAGRIR